MSITIKENPIKDIQWKHAITDNTFDNEFSNKIDKAFTDWSLNHNTWKNKTKRDGIKRDWQPIYGQLKFRWEIQ